RRHLFARLDAVAGARHLEETLSGRSGAGKGSQSSVLGGRSRGALAPALGPTVRPAPEKRGPHPPFRKAWRSMPFAPVGERGPAGSGDAGRRVYPAWISGVECASG